VPGCATQSTAAVESITAAEPISSGGVERSSRVSGDRSSESTGGRTGRAKEPSDWGREELEGDGATGCDTLGHVESQDCDVDSERLVRAHSTPGRHRAAETTVSRHVTEHLFVTTMRHDGLQEEESISALRIPDRRSRRIWTAVT
jgi:hypothetical protein